MITIILILIALIITGVLLKTNWANCFKKGPSTYDPVTPTWRFWSIVLTGIALIVTALIQPLGVERVDAGHVGIRVNLSGDERGVSNYEYKTGWVIVNSWTNRLYEFPTYQQHIDYPEQTVISKGGFPTTIKPSFNYSLNSGDVGDMFQNLRLSITDIEQKWLQTAIVGTVNDVANRWPIDSIFNHREQFESEIVAETNKRVSKWFNVSQLRTNIVPPPALQDAIVAKTRAVQDAQAAIQKALVADAQAQEKIAIAKGDSAFNVITASGKAEAIKKEQLYLTGDYINYIRALRWDGKYPTTMAGSGSDLLIGIK